jgi:hypothetical protein
VLDANALIGAPLAAYATLADILITTPAALAEVRDPAARAALAAAVGARLVTREPDEGNVKAGKSMV